jgi:dihydrofolate synthase/folylpolyglutamate synthase
MDDDIFFREWAGRRAGESRGLERAGLLAESLGVRTPRIPVLGVVGSKGKGTTATYASATLAAAGLRVVTVTGPSFRSNRERVRVDGAAVTAADLAGLAARLAPAIDGLPPRGEHYLAPSGLFTIAGIVHAHDIGADALVIEAGMGGASDELGLFAPTVVAIASVFGEHLGKLGDTVPDIAREKAGVAAAVTRAVLSLPQTPEVAAAIAETVAARTGGRISVTTVTPDGADGRRALPPDVTRNGDGAPVAVRAGVLPAGLSRQNGVLGRAAGLRMLDVIGAPPPAPDVLDATLAGVRLPARLSWHRVPGSRSEILVDSAIERRGVATALAAARERWGGVDHVLVCLPDHKDVDGAIAELAATPVTYVRLPDAHLRFRHPLPDHWRVVDAADLTPAAVAALGGRVVALGTVYFTGRVLDVIDADTERLFAPAR